MWWWGCDLADRRQRRKRWNDKEKGLWRNLDRRGKLPVERRRFGRRLVHLEVGAEEKWACHHGTSRSRAVEVLRSGSVLLSSSPSRLLASSAKIARPMRTEVEPSSIATRKSSLI